MDAVDERLRIRGEKRSEKEDFNGFKQVIVPKITNEAQTEIYVYFYNQVAFEDILNPANSTDSRIKNLKHHEIFPITGGQRILAGHERGKLKVIDISRKKENEEIVPNALVLTIKPVGDYSTYTLGIGEVFKFDPIFNEIEFKFRPGCFNTQCLERKKYLKAVEEPKISYLAKDFSTFKHTMITAMNERVPGWEPTSEADLDLVLIELLSAAADELSDFQDRVMNEAYLGTARKRVSLARHARLMDYHIYQGNQASTWLALELKNLDDGQDFSLPSKFLVTTEKEVDSELREEDKVERLAEQEIIFSTKKEQQMHYLLNRLSLYTWEDTRSYLKAGSTQADLKILVRNWKTHEEDYRPSSSRQDYEDVLELIKPKDKKKEPITHLLLQEWKENPETGRKTPGDKAKRQLLKLSAAEYDKDPITGEWYLRVHWDEKDRLKQDYFSPETTHPENENTSLRKVSYFHGNLVKIFQGEFREAKFFEPSSDIMLASNEDFYERTQNWGIICRLPDSPLSYQDVYNGGIPNGERPPKSTLEVFVRYTDGSINEWSETISFIESDEDEVCFIVETDEEGQSSIRFGNGTNGKKLPENSEVWCHYQIGIGQEGNLGANTLTKIPFHQPKLLYIERCWNPRDVRNGRDPEPVEEIIRNVPEAYRERQLRAVTVNEYLDDYEKRAQEHKKVAHARAAYRWMGSWRIVQINIDPIGTTELLEASLHKELLQHIETVKLIGDQIIIRPAQFVPLEINVTVCIHPDYWIEDVREQIEAEFSDGFTPDGRKAFFHPDCWTFGQPVRKSQLIARIQAINGVHHVIDTSDEPISIKRWISPQARKDGQELAIQPDEIILVKNDPSQVEKGFIYFDFEGGRQ